MIYIDLDKGILINILQLFIYIDNDVYLTEKFFTSATKEHLISRPSNELEISLLFHLTDN